MTDSAHSSQAKRNDAVVPAAVFLPFVLVTTLFALWGFANDITNPMVKAFSKILLMSNFEGSLVQFAFYGGYFAMAFPGRVDYQEDLLQDRDHDRVGAVRDRRPVVYSRKHDDAFWPFLIASSILTCRLSFLETGANPYILSMGSEETSTQRLNFSQAFNPIGSLLGMFTAQQLIIARLNGATRAERVTLMQKSTGETRKRSRDMTGDNTHAVRCHWLGDPGVPRPDRDRQDAAYTGQESPARCSAER